jgi:hypothetical protein
VLPEKTCARCGRRITWRKKWARTWDSVLYCSSGCRSHRLGPTDQAIEDAILHLLTSRAGDASLCPSEAARRVSPDDWRPLMEPAREAARRLQARGLLTITQGGRPVDPSTARGPIRLARPRR